MTVVMLFYVIAVIPANRQTFAPQAVGDRDRTADQQPNAEPPLPPTAGPPPPRPRHVRLLSPVCHLRLHTRLAGCLTSATDQVTGRTHTALEF